ncbi:mCG147418 [Mus musculus]|nr:mCG147418 [Mus musculus]
MLCEPVTYLWWNKNWKSMETPSMLMAVTALGIMSAFPAGRRSGSLGCRNHRLILNSFYGNPQPKQLCCLVLTVCPVAPIKAVHTGGE